MRLPFGAVVGTFLLWLLLPSFGCGRSRHRFLLTLRRRALQTLHCLTRGFLFAQFRTFALYDIFQRGYLPVQLIHCRHKLLVGRLQLFIG